MMNQIFIRFRFTFFSLVLFAVPLVSAPGQVAPPHGVYENFDMRETEAGLRNSAGALPAYRTRQLAGGRAQVVVATVQKMAAARTALAAEMPHAQIEPNRFGTAPEVIGVESAARFLTPDSAAPREKTVRDFLAGHADLFGLTLQQMNGLVKIADYSNPAGNLSWVEFRQEIAGIPIFQGEIRAAFTTKGALARTTGNLAAGLDEALLPIKPNLSAAQAATFAAATIGYNLDSATLQVRSVENSEHVTKLAAGPFAQEIKASLFCFPLEPGVATLAYGLVLWEEHAAYYILVDANDGTLLFRKNLTSHQSQTATYDIYDNDSPSPLSPSNVLPGSGLQPPGIPRTSVTLVSELPAFDDLGWITDGNNTTSGNNVDAGLDVASPDGIDPGTQAVGSPNRVFSFDYNPPPDGSDSPTNAAYRNGAVVNIFFWANRYHDRLYQLGFTEAARNFQGTNFGRGGIGNDAISAQVQDYSDVNNANFTTPPDGTPGKMQMFIYTSPTPDRDSSLDVEVVLHELTHGTSSRLHANGSGLTGMQPVGMGEGWSDFYARALLSTADEDVDGIYPTAAYSNHQLAPFGTNNYYYGSRRFPYAVKSTIGTNGRPHNPLTFADIDPAQINLTNGAFSPAFNSIAYEVHNVGEVWCMTLLEMRARFIKRLGFAAGNQRALQVVTDAMKLDPSGPSLVQGRDSIIVADNAGFGGEDVADIRLAFALRGLGVGASTPNNFTFTVTESFAIQPLIANVTFSDYLGNSNGIAEPGEPLVFSVSIRNILAAVNTNVTVTIGNFISRGDTPAQSTETRLLNYTVPVGTPCQTFITLLVTATDDSGTQTRTINLQIGSSSDNLSESFETVTPPALPVGWTTTTVGGAGTSWVSATSPTLDGTNVAMITEVQVFMDSSLLSPVFAVPSSGGQLVFKHTYFEKANGNGEGRVLEIKIGAGSFTDIITAGGSFVQGGYNGTIFQFGGNPLDNRMGWIGTNSGIVATVVNLPASAAGQNVQLRWRFGSNNSVFPPASTWTIDSVSGAAPYTCASIDADGDGIPNGYETVNGLNPNDPADGALDADLDGITNLEEYLAGTDPQDPNSAFQILSVARNATIGSVTFHFSSVNGKTYRAEYRDSLSTPTIWTALPPNIAGTGATIQISDPSAAGQTQRFYRVALVQ